MLIKLSLSLLLIIFLTDITHCQDLQNKYFAEAGVNGSITIYDYNKREWKVSNNKELFKATVPASTFKIINLLIALESKVIKSELDTIKWPGKIDTALYGYRPNTYRDMTVKEAFEVSAGWVFMELSKRIGKKQYIEYLSLCGYGNMQVSNDADFWNFGPLKISPKNQIEFLIKLYEGKSPFSKRNLDILKSVMTRETNDYYILRSKTGWGREDKKDIGWYVGYIEKDGNTYFFATRLIKDIQDKNPNFQKLRIDITDKIFSDLGIL